MGTIIIKLNPEKLENLDLDLRYLVPGRIEEVTKGKVQDNGYDYSLDDTNSMIVFMTSENPEEDVNEVLQILKNEKFLDNDIYESGIVAISHGDGEDEDEYKVIHPDNFKEKFRL
ncbi:hypothetical protein [Clostridium sp. YIM B02500]|uniref:hypothetical protein n=1 Tax=Clostridium sp. YIM B02500 TaxID=2910681 RepID=UPI001EEDCB8D|nr:hypothetical protein [Clostridium sp. YIM B02500]